MQGLLRQLRLEARRGTDPAPVRVGQDEMIEQTIEGMSATRDRQRPHAREITLGIFPRPVDLCEHHLALRPL